MSCQNSVKSIIHYICIILLMISIWRNIFQLRKFLFFHTKMRSIIAFFPYFALRWWAICRFILHCNYVNQFHEIFYVFTGKIRGKPTNKGEDDGYLMDLVYHPETHSSSYVVIDAKTMKEVFIVPLPQRIPFGVHGIWFDKQYLDQTNS